MIDNAVYQRLAGFAGLTALVSDRIYPGRAKQGAQLPYVIYSAQAPIDLAEDLDSSGELVSARVQVDAWGADQTSAANVGEQVRAALRDFTGTVGGVAVADVKAAGGFDDIEEPTNDSPTRLFRRSRDFILSYNE